MSSYASLRIDDYLTQQQCEEVYADSFDPIEVNDRLVLAYIGIPVRERLMKRRQHFFWINDPRLWSAERVSRSMHDFMRRAEKIGVPASIRRYVCAYLFRS